MEPAQPTLNSLRVALLGDNGVGKRTFIQKLAKKQNQQLISPNSLMLCENEVSFHLESNSGPCQITLVFFNINPQEFQKNQAYKQQISSKLKTCTNAFFMFSLLDRQTYKSTPLYYRIWTQINEATYNILISTKADDADNIKIKQKAITYHRKKNMQFYNISTKTGYNLFKPFVYLFRATLKNIAFDFIEPQNYVDLQPEMDFTKKVDFEKQITQASVCYFPIEDEQC